VIGALIEAWAEFRVHRARVLMSLIGVAIAVAALAGVVGIGAVATQAQTEQLERGGGRPATLVLTPPYDAETGDAADPARLEAIFRQVVERYSITYAGAVIWSDSRIQFADGADSVMLTAVAPAYGPMHRVEIATGRWFTAFDESRLSPALVVSEAVWQRLGAPDLATNPTVTVYGAQPTTGVIVGVLPPDPFAPSLQAYVLGAGLATIATPAQAAAPMYEFWVPLELADTLQERIRAEVASALGEGFVVDVQRQDYLAWGTSDPLEPIRVVLLGIAGLILALGALSLVNIALVTVRQRVREIGIRRAFGATAPRVFLAVMLESVLATLVAGVLGVVLAIVVVQSEWVRGFVAPGLQDAVPFPAEAAVIGLVAATAVGALAGLLPALVAVRVKVIDAIRY